jgi:hypothetical protein
MTSRGYFSAAGCGAHGSQAAVMEGCALRQMYLTVTRRAEFPLPTAGEGPRTERLENYPWIVELR